MFTKGLKGVEDTVVHTVPPALGERDVLGVESTPVTLLATRVDSKSGWMAEQGAKRRGEAWKEGRQAGGGAARWGTFQGWEGSQAGGGHR